MILELSFRFCSCHEIFIVGPYRQGGGRFHEPRLNLGMNESPNADLIRIVVGVGC